MDTSPVARQYGDVKMAKSKRFGVRLSKLAIAPAVVLSAEEFVSHCASIAERMAPILSVLRRRNSRTASERMAMEQAQSELRALVVPLYGIVFKDDVTRTQYFVSGGVLSDYRREGIKAEVNAWPYAFAIGSRSYGAGKAKAMSESFEAAEPDDSSITAMVARCARECRMFGDEHAAMAFESWRFHGTIAKECRDIECRKINGSPCAYHRFQMKELIETCRVYVIEAMQDNRSGFHGSRIRHKLPKWSPEALSIAFGGNFKRAERKQPPHKEVMVRVVGTIPQESATN